MTIPSSNGNSFLFFKELTVPERAALITPKHGVEYIPSVLRGDDKQYEHGVLSFFLK